MSNEDKSVDTAPLESSCDTDATEPTVQMEIPAHLVETVTDFLARRLAKRKVGFCFGVPLPVMDGKECWAIYEIENKKWIVCRSSS